VRCVNQTALRLHDGLLPKQAELRFATAQPRLADNALNCLLLIHAEGFAESIDHLFLRHLVVATASILRVVPIIEPIIPICEEVRHIALGPSLRHSRVDGEPRGTIR